MGNTTITINPRVDVVFKKIFGVEENKDLLISLINAIVSEEDQVTEVTLLNPYNPKNFIGEKLSILDLKAKSQEGKFFNIEIQITDEADYDKRALYYWAKLYTEQLQTREEYSTLSKAIGIHILYFLSIPGVDKYHNVFHITEKDTGVRYFKDLELHTIELKKFCPTTQENLPEFIKRIRTSLDMWSAFLTRHDLLSRENLPKPLDDPSLKKAIEVVSVMSLTAEEREAYESHLKWIRMETSALKKREEEGFMAGLIEGEDKGKKEVARQLKQASVPIELIVKATGLTEEEITKL